jgi:hypothetical protein
MSCSKNSDFSVTAISPKIDLILPDFVPTSSLFYKQRFTNSVLQTAFYKQRLPERVAENYT